MEYDKNKVDEMTLALMYLGATKRQGKPGAQAWKAFGWETIKRLYERGWIEEPKMSDITLNFTEEGYRVSAELFKEYFGK